MGRIAPKNNPTQTVALARVKLAADSLRLARAESEVRIRALVNDELLERRTRVQVEVRDAYNVGVSKADLGRALGTKDRGTVYKYLDGFEPAEVAEPQQWTIDTEKSIITLNWLDVASDRVETVRLDGPQQYRYTIGTIFTRARGEEQVLKLENVGDETIQDAYPALIAKRPQYDEAIRLSWGAIVEQWREAILPKGGF